MWQPNSSLEGISSVIRSWIGCCLRSSTFAQRWKRVALSSNISRPWRSLQIGYIAAIDAPISQEDQIVTFLGSLPSFYSTLVTALEARDTITLSYAQQALIWEEQRLKGESKAGGSATTGGSTGRALLGKQTEKGKKSHQKKNVCFLCGETGDFCRDCPRNQQMFKPKHKPRPATTQSRGSHIDIEYDTDEGAFGASTKPGDSNGWIIDSGAIWHQLERYW